ncbi:hypothetical protein CP061683_0500B, partial [Chlamydia psittaci 06-1683]
LIFSRSQDCEISV